MPRRRIFVSKQLQCVIAKRRLFMCCCLLYDSSFLTQTIISVLWRFKWPRQLCTLLVHCSFYKQLQHSCVDFDVSWLNSTGAFLCGTWFSKKSICSSFYWASSCCRRVAKATKALPCCAINARICPSISLGIVWRIYVRFVVDIDIKILGIVKRWSAILRVVMVMEEEL